MNDPNESSYYEIALTNRQVVIAFVLMLTIVLTIFLSGVWVGKNASQRLAEATTPPEVRTADSPAADTLANLEELKFFSESEQSDGEDLQKPDLSGLLNQPRTDTTLAQDVGSASAAPGAAGSASSDPAPGVAERRPAAGNDQRRAANRPAEAQKPPPASPPRSNAQQGSTPRPSQARPPAAAAEAATGWVVQVFSTHDEPQARKVLNQVRAGGHSGFLSSVDVGGQTMFRVRVGPFDDRSKAEGVSGKLRRELRLDPWVTAASN